MVSIKDRAKADAEAVLAAYWMDRGCPVDAAQVANAVGLSVFTAQLGSNVSGMLVGQGSLLEPEIYVDIDDNVLRQRFTIAHELGHYFDRVKSGRSVTTFIDRRDGAQTFEEFYANEFAGNLLMPEREVRRQSSIGVALEEMAAYFKVSLSALTVRLKRLGLR